MGCFSSFSNHAGEHNNHAARVLLSRKQRVDIINCKNIIIIYSDNIISIKKLFKINTFTSGLRTKCQ